MCKLLFGEKGRYFILAALFASFAAFVALSDSFRQYEAEVRAVVIPKSDKVAVSLSSTTENVALFASSDTFQNVFFNEPSAEFGWIDDTSREDRPALFADLVSVEASGNGGSLFIRARSEDPAEAKLLARAVALSLFRFAGQYYNVKEDVDFRIVSGPTAWSVSDVALHALSSLGIGVLVVIAFFFLLEMIPRVAALLLGAKRREATVFPTEVFEPKRPESPFFKEGISEEEFIPREERFPELPEEEELPVEPIVPEPGSKLTPIRTPEKKARAPLNLTAFSAEEERFLNEFSFDERPNEGGAKEIETAYPASERPDSVVEAPVEPAEPTEEEYKRKLNELLRG